MRLFCLRCVCIVCTLLNARFNAQEEEEEVRRENQWAFE
jgi:hypothetical protein